MTAQSLTVNLEAERAFLACLMRNPDVRLVIGNGITVDHFATTNTREAFEGITAYLETGTPPDAATLKGAISDAALIELETSLSENASAANSHVYAKKLKDAKAARDDIAARDWLVRAVQAGRPPHELRPIIDGIEQAALGEPAKGRFLEVDDLCVLPASENWLVKGYVTLDSLSAAFGDPGCGKSFLAIDLACHIATGRPWRGQPVKQGKVLYIAGEGKNGLSKRFKAWFEHHDEAPRNIKICTIPIALTDPAGMASLVSEIKAMPESPVLIVVDTINRNFGPGDENSTADMTRAIAGLDALRIATGAAIFGLHHSGHNDKNRGRGSSVLRASLDCEFAVEKFDATVQVRCTKAKDFDHPPPLAWTLEKQPLPWMDSDGKPIDSAILEPSVCVNKPVNNGKFTRPQRVALDSLSTAIERHGTDGKVLVGDWKRVAIEGGITASESRQGQHNAFVRAADALVSAGLVIQDGNLRYPSTRKQAYTERKHVDVVYAGNVAVNHVNNVNTPLKGCVHVYGDAKPDNGDGDSSDAETLAGVLDEGEIE